MTSQSDNFTAYDTINPLHSDLSGKVILVTGASRGIGRAISIAYAQAGASGLALLARNRAGLNETRTACMKAQRHGSDKNFQVLLLEVDITSTEAVASALKEVETKFKRLDIVVNNAGQFQGHQNNIGDMDPGSWWNIWTVNVNGLFNVTRAALPLLLDGLRIIVNMTSITAHLITGGFSDYETSKLAILRLSQFIAAEYGDQGVLCYAIHPGTILTDMPAQIPQEWWKKLHIDLEDSLEIAAHATVFYSNERRDWLSGRYISANWDVNELLAKKDEIVAGDKLRVRMVL